MPNFVEISNYIGGRRSQGRDGGETIVSNPADNSELARFRHSSEADVDAAIAASVEGFAVWKDYNPYQRAAVLTATASEIRKRLEEFAVIMTLESGKAIAESRAEWAFSANLFDWFAAEAVRCYGRTMPLRTPGFSAEVGYAPIGPVALFSTWNFPAVTPLRKVSAALAAGCSVVVKPAKETPGCTLAMIDCLEAAGLPKGVFNILVGSSDMISARLIAAKEIRKISLTGSVRVGKLLTRMAADTLKKVTMELGGHAPVIIHDDVDPAAVANKCVAGKFRNAGQICTSPTRFYVNDAVYDTFENQFVKATEALKIGDGLDETNTVGALVNARRMAEVEALIGDARDKGATVLTGGSRHGNVGCFYKPTVLANVPGDARLSQEEPFGPIAMLHRWSDYASVIAQANALDFGLASYVFSNDRERIARTSRDLEAGLVGVNSFVVSVPEAPFGGIKESGYGLEGGAEGIREYQISKTVTYTAV